MQLQLNSPFGYSPDFASDFESTTVSCGSTGYAFTSPAAYAVATNTAAAPEPPSCAAPYTVQAGDSCDAIALRLSVPTFAVLRAGAQNSECTNLVIGAPLCLPAPCALYRVQYDETCATVLAAHAGLTIVNLLAWNPNINALCTNLAGLAESLICVSAPGAGAGTGVTTQITTSTATLPMPTEAPSTPVPRPTNAAVESAEQCAKWYTVQDGDYCQVVSIRQNIALRDFFFLNPSIDAPDCVTNLWLDTAYCVQALGDIATYTGYPYTTTAPLYTLTSTAYTTTAASVPAAVAPSVTPIAAPLPLAAGSLSSCAAYVEHVHVPAVQDQNVQPDVPVLTENINSCTYAVTAYDVLIEDFLSWNPSLASTSPCQLQPGLRYCALDDAASLPRQFIFHTI